MPVKPLIRNYSYLCTQKNIIPVGCDHPQGQSCFSRRLRG